MSVTPPTVPLPNTNGSEPLGAPEEILDGDVPSSGLSASDNFSISQQSLSQMPHFGFDHFVSNFPQELGEFTAIPCFEPDAQGNTSMVGTDLKPGSADWLQFMNE
jgi:hypothetical protein